MAAIAMKPPVDDVHRECQRIAQSGLLSPQERALLEQLVRLTLDDQTGRLYQKALADNLGIASAKQIGVIATRLRTKLADHYRTAQGQPAVQIELPARGYEVRFFYRPPVFALSHRVQLLVANAKAAIDQRTLPGASAALEFLDLALDADAGHPLILALKAYCHATRALYGTYPRSDLEVAETIVEQARSATDRPWESWFAEGCVKMALHWDWSGAASSFEQAIALSGGDAQYQPWYTAFLACQGRAVEAVPLLRVAVTRAHDSPIVRADLAAAQIYAGQLSDAEETITTALALFGPRTHYLLQVHLAILHEARGDGRAALAAIEQLPFRWPRTAITLGLRALFSGLGGDHKTARRHFAKLRAARALAGRFVPAGQLCIAALGTGNLTGAVGWLREGAVVERDPNLVLTNVYPFFRHLHHHPEFRTFVLETMKLALPR
jgi:Tfp pilus assembly protein PilF